MSKLIGLTVLITLVLGAMNSHAQSPDSSAYSLPQLYSDDGDGFTVIAHRGASAYYPENTMAAFRGAVEMEAEMIELDVMMSSDGIPVVFHDARLDDHTDGKGLLADCTLKELKALDAGSWFGSEFAGERIPTLEEVLQYAAGRIALNIEIKTEAVSDRVRGGVEEKAVELVGKYGMEEHVLFSSFDYRAVAHLKEIAPDLPAALLYEKSQSGNMLPSDLVNKYGSDAFNCHYGEFKGKRLRDIKQHGIPVYIYTVNSKRRMRKLIRMGVSGIFSDKPDLLKQVAEQVAR